MNPHIGEQIVAKRRFSQNIFPLLTFPSFSSSRWTWKIIFKHFSGEGATWFIFNCCANCFAGSNSLFRNANFICAMLSRQITECGSLSHKVQGSCTPECRMSNFWCWATSPGWLIQATCELKFEEIADRAVRREKKLALRNQNKTNLGHVSRDTQHVLAGLRTFSWSQLPPIVT